MRQSLDITFRNVRSSQAVITTIEKQVEKLEQFCNRITHCRVVIDAPHRKQHKGKLYEVLIELQVPNGTLVVNRHSGDDPAHTNLYVALRDAFDAAKRQLQDYVELRAS
jgi:ribosome-associated translation inhibitor RaiA